MRERLLWKLWFLFNKCQIQLCSVWWIKDEDSRVSMYTSSKHCWLFLKSFSSSVSNFFISFQARNEYGWSQPSEMFSFTTSQKNIQSEFASTTTSTLTNATKNIICFIRVVLVILLLFKIVETNSSTKMLSCLQCCRSSHPGFELGRPRKLYQPRSWLKPLLASCLPSSSVLRCRKIDASENNNNSKNNNNNNDKFLPSSFWHQSCQMPPPERNSSLGNLWILIKEYLKY